MRCDACGDESVVAFDVPDELREYAPDEAGVAAICPTCLDVRPAPDADAEDGDVEDAAAPEVDAADAATTVHDAFPADPDAAAGVALLCGLLESLVLNKPEIQSLVDYLEASGTDVFLVLDRLEADPDVDPQVDLERRRPQLQQLI